MSDRSTIPLEARFWSKVNVSTVDDCWEWQASKKDTGYGQIYVDGGPARAHRISWELTQGEIPEGLLVLHRCDNKICVNPNHLFIGTHSDNLVDSYNKGRNYPRGEQKSGAKLKGAEVLEIRRLYATGKITQNKLARLFEVHEGAVSNIIYRHTWKHI